MSKSKNLKTMEIIAGHTKYFADKLEDMYDIGYTVGYKQGIIDNNGNAKRQANDSHEQGYKEGLEDAWQYMKKIAFKETEGGIPLAELKEMFGEDACLLTEVLRNYSVTSVIDIIKAYEEKQKQSDEIKVGDEVTERDLPAKGIVTRANEVCCYVMWNDGSSGSRDKDDLNKTGKHIDGIAKILEQLQEGE